MTAALPWDQFGPFLRAIHNCPTDTLPPLIARDWLLEHGATEAQEQEAFNPPVWSNLLPTDYYGRGSGIGRGSGSGSGSGRGIGIGSGIGRGRGSGSGRGIGSGSGIGSGRGIGRGIGSDSDSGRGREILQMEAGKNYLILTVDWYAFVGRCVRQVGPYEYEFERVSKFDTNAGDVFGEIAAGDENLRRGASYQHFQGKALLGLGRVAVFEWAGQLPQEFLGTAAPARRRSRANA